MDARIPSRQNKRAPKMPLNYCFIIKCRYAYSVHVFWFGLYLWDMLATMEDVDDSDQTEYIKKFDQYLFG